MAPSASNLAFDLAMPLGALTIRTLDLCFLSTSICQLDVLRRLAQPMPPLLFCS